MNDITKQIVVYDISEQVIFDLQTKAKTLEIKSIDDKEGYNLVDVTRKEAKKLKIEVENRRKELKADALAFGRLVDSEAARYSKPLEEAEAILSEKQKKIDEEKERIKLANEQEAKLPIRKLLLSEFTIKQNDEEIKVLSDLDFQALIQKLVAERQAKIQAEQERLIAEERKKEQEKLANERLKLEAERKAFELEQEAKKQKDIKGEQERINALKKEKDGKVMEWKRQYNYDPTTDLIQQTNNGVALYRFVAEINLNQ